MELSSLILIKRFTFCPINQIKFSTNILWKNSKPLRKRVNSDNPLILTDYLKQALIGLTLGDLSLEKATNNSNIRLRFDQSNSVHSEYIYFLYDLFKIYTLTLDLYKNKSHISFKGFLRTFQNLYFNHRFL